MVKNGKKQDADYTQWPQSNHYFTTTAEEKAAYLNSVFEKQCNAQSPTSRSCSLLTNTAAECFSFSPIECSLVIKKLWTLNT